MADENILLIERQEGVCILTLNRPDKLNSFNDELTFQLQDALSQAARDTAVRAVVITGSGRGFCAGQDLQARLGDNSEVSLGESIRRRYNPIITKIRRTEKPFLAAINGVAAGAGMSLAIACDIKIAGSDVTFIQSFSKVGLIPDSGSTFMLPRLVGYTKAMELMLSADKLSAQEALTLGLINQIVAGQDVVACTIALAKKLAAGPTKAFGLTKRAVNRALFNDLEELLEYEAQLQEIAGRSNDFSEGVQAFIGKRAPVYSGT